MSNKTLRDAVRLEPFQPFFLRMADGREFEIRHPEFIIVPERARTFIFHDYRDGAYRVFDLRHVQKIKYPMDVEPEERAAAEAR